MQGASHRRTYVYRSLLPDYVKDNAIFRGMNPIEFLHFDTFRYVSLGNNIFPAIGTSATANRMMTIMSAWGLSIYNEVNGHN